MEQRFLDPSFSKLPQDMYNGLEMNFGTNRSVLGTRKRRIFNTTTNTTKMSTFGPYHHIVTDKNYDTELLDLEISNGQETAKGQGRLTCDWIGNQSLWAITTATKKEKFSNLRVGEMVPSDQYFRIKAKNSCDHTITAERIENLGGTIGADPRIWDYRNPFLSKIDVVRPDLPTRCFAEAICDWPVLINCFPYHTRSSDFRLVIKVDDGQFSISFAKEWVQFSFDPSSLNDANRLNDYLDAVILATGYACGQLGLEKVRRTSINGELRESINTTWQHWKSELFGPFGQCGQREQVPVECWQNLISLMTKFLISDGLRRFNQAFVALWSSVDRSFSVSALIACSVLEGLCSDSNPSNPAVFSNEQIASIESHMSSNEFALLVEGDSNGTKRKQLVERAKGSLKSLRSRSASSLLRELCVQERFGLSLSVFQSWKTLRHSTAHGHFDLLDVSSSERSELINARNAVYHAINVMVFNRVGYTGDVFNWQQGAFTGFS